MIVCRHYVEEVKVAAAIENDLAVPSCFYCNWLFRGSFRSQIIRVSQPSALALPPNISSIKGRVVHISARMNKDSISWLNSRWRGIPPIRITPAHIISIHQTLEVRFLFRSLPVVGVNMVHFPALIGSWLGTCSHRYNFLSLPLLVIDGPVEVPIFMVGTMPMPSGSDIINLHSYSVYQAPNRVYFRQTGWALHSQSYGQEN